MRKLLSLTALTLLFGATAAQAAGPGDGEARLARALQGRVAGEPVNCIDLYRVRSSRVIDDTAILYDAGSVIYVNRPRSGAEDLNRWDTLVTRTPSTRLCSVDTVHVVNLPSGALTGIVFLGDFVPYRRDSSASRH
jgi:hypothetical protein